MTPVISPIWFWLFDICGTLDIVFDLLFGASAIGCIFFAIGLIACIMDEYESDKLKIKSILKKFILVTIPLFILMVATPTKNTLTKMLIAQNVTYERVEVATDTVETVYNDIMALFEDNNSEGETE